MTPEALNSAKDSVIAAARINTENPFDGMLTLTAALYAFWALYHTDKSTFETWLAEITSQLHVLHRLNDIKGNA